jgi:aminopeptidase-like protein
MPTKDFGIMNTGDQMHAFAAKLFPICRSLTGNGVRETLAEIREHVPALTVQEVASGTQAFDWVVPDEWNISAAKLTGPDGQVVADFANHNLHVVGYSEPVDCVMPLEQLQEHLHSLPELPDAIPYVTSYYRRYWGFCLPHRVRSALPPGNYRAKIDSTLIGGSLTYGEVILPGESVQEVFLSTYVCHPSMANNELSGPVVTTWLIKWLMEQKRRFTYRVVFIPETLGSIVYLSRNLELMRRNISAGFNISCVGDDRCYSYLPSRNGDTVSDRTAQYVLRCIDPGYIRYSYLDRGSDERQYCAPGVDLPVCSVMRSKYGCYPEYHSSADDLTLVTPTGLEGAYIALKRCIEILEVNRRWRATVLCEPQLGKRGLYPTISSRDGAQSVQTMMNLLAYADGARDLLSIAEVIHADPLECDGIAWRLAERGLLEDVG